jgi:predicted DNA-binding ArsR family transcriptional regulator
LIPQINIDISLSDISDISENHTLPLEQLVETLTRAESWVEVENAIDNYPQSTKSHIWGLLDTVTQERLHELKRQNADCLTDLFEKK